MPKAQDTENRREFLRNGLRAVALGSLVFGGLSLGWRGFSGTAKESSCSIDLPCRSCPKLLECRKPEAVNEKQKPKNRSSK